MVIRRCIALSAVLTSCLSPAVAYAGSGGTPTPPAAGKSTDYCCQVWERGDTQSPADAASPASKVKSGASFLNGTGCQAIAEDDFSRNQCTGTVAKCRGELFTPNLGKVERCLTP